MSNEINSLYRFGKFRFDSQKGKLWQDEELILLSPKATELLTLLLESDEKFVSKEEIFETVWSGTYVEEGVLTQNIYTLRKALGNDEDGKPLIENKMRLGYRLTVPIIQEGKIAKENDNETTEQSETKTQFFSRRLLVASSLFLLAIIVFSAIGIIYRSKITSFFRKPIESVKFTRLTDAGNLTNAALSPDGNFAALVRGNNVFLKDMASGRDIKLDIPDADSFGTLQFSPDGNFLYFRSKKIFNTLANIFKVSRFGGEKELIADKTWASFSISPDGKKLAYFKFKSEQPDGMKLVILNLESKEEKEFTALQPPTALCVSCSPAWSPDGSKIIYTVNNASFGVSAAVGNQLLMLNLADEKIEPIKIDKLKRFEQVAWLPDGKSFFVSASEGSFYMHLWKVFYSDGEVQPVTNGLLNYGKVSISADGKKVLAVQMNESSNLFVANAENLNEQKQITFGNQNNFGQTALNWIDEQRFIYSVQSEQNPVENLNIINLTDNSKIQVPNESQVPLRFPSSDGKFVYFAASINGFSNIFQMTADGKEIKLLTNETSAHRQTPRVSNDGKYVYYTFTGKVEKNIRRFDLVNGKEEMFFNNPEFPVSPFMEISPDNKFITFFRMSIKNLQMDKYNAPMVVVSTENPNDIKMFPVSIIPPIRRFSPDSQTIDYILADTDGTQIVRQAFDGSEPKPIYTIPDGRIFNFAWSKDGKKLAISRGQQLRDAVLLTEFDK